MDLLLILALGFIGFVILSPVILMGILFIELMFPVARYVEFEEED